MSQNNSVKENRIEWECVKGGAGKEFKIYLIKTSTVVRKYRGSKSRNVQSTWMKFCDKAHEWNSMKG